MKKEVSERELFENMPVPKAVATLSIPTIISQVVTMIYNLADTFFVGQIGDPPSVHTGSPDQFTGRQLPADRLSGCAVYSGQFPDQLHPSGHGQRYPVGHPHVQPAGTFKHSFTHHHGPDCGPVWHALNVAITSRIPIWMVIIFCPGQKASPRSLNPPNYFLEHIESPD